MKGKLQIFIIILLGFSLVLDIRSSSQWAKEGISMCLNQLIPSLFPFMVLSKACSMLWGNHKVPVLSSLLYKCGMGSGSENFYILGLLGGYPLGAQLIADAFRKKEINQEDAQHYLHFCSNPGPGFILAMTALLFSSPAIPFLIWGVIGISSLAVGYLFTVKEGCKARAVPESDKNISEILRESMIAMISICGWVIIIKILMSFIRKWILWNLPDTINIILTGLLEIASGTVLLSELQDPSVRLELCVVFLSLGGLCVYLQTQTITAPLGTFTYVSGKLLQADIAILLSHLCCTALSWTKCNMILVIITAIPPVFALILKISSNQRENHVYCK